MKKKPGIELWLWSTFYDISCGLMRVSVNEPSWNVLYQEWQAREVHGVCVDIVAAMTGISRRELLQQKTPFAVWCTMKTEMV